MHFKHPILFSKPEIFTISSSLQMKNVEGFCKQDSWDTTFGCPLYGNLQDVDESSEYRNILIAYEVNVWILFCL